MNLPVLSHHGEPLPCDTCRGRCCTFAPMSRREMKIIRKAHGLPRGAKVVDLPGGIGVMGVLDERNGVCAFLVDGRCSVHELRPMTCRAYGTVAKLPCAYLYPAEADAVAQAGIERHPHLAAVLAGGI